MKIQIVRDEQNLLLHRREIDVIVKEYESTPTRGAMLKSIAANLGTDEKNILLDKIDQQFGKKESVCYVKVYENEEFKKKYEPEYKLKRTASKTEEKKEEVKEEPKEQPKEEEKSKGEEK